jgi:serine/threonine protein kinase
MLKELKNYTIISKIASGGMSEVYLAIDTNTGKEVALKILDPKLSIDPEYIHRFKKEASISSQLNHKNIVKILSYGTFKDNYYIAYEYIEGITLDKYIKQKSLSISEIENISIQILEALYYAHSNNIIHRDIKPSNIMIAKGTVKILDFGIAKQELAATVTKTGLFMGSPHYVSPEQIEGHDIDYRSDIYSFGIVLYEMIEGKVPFSSDTPWGIIRAHLDKSIPEITRDAPTYLKEIVKKCLFKKKEYRFRSAQEIIYLIKNKEEPEEDKTVMIERGKILAGKELDNEDYEYEGGKRGRPSRKLEAWAVVILIIIAFLIITLVNNYDNITRYNKNVTAEINTNIDTTTTLLDESDLKDEFSKENKIKILDATTTTQYHSTTTTKFYSSQDYENDLAEEKFLDNVYTLLDEYNLAFNHMGTYHKEGWIFNDPNEVALEETFLVKLIELSNKLGGFSFPNSLAEGRNNLVNISHKINEIENNMIICMKNNDYEDYVANLNNFWSAIDQLFNQYNAMVDIHNNKYHG